MNPSLLLLQKIISVSTETARYDLETGALCPVCVRFNLRPPKARVNSTRGEIRACACPQCGNTFTAVGPERMTEPKPEPRKENTNAPKNKKALAGKKSGKRKARK